MLGSLQLARRHSEQLLPGGRGIQTRRQAACLLLTSLFAETVYRPMSVDFRLRDRVSQAFSETECTRACLVVEVDRAITDFTEEYDF